MATQRQRRVLREIQAAQTAKSRSGLRQDERCQRAANDRNRSENGGERYQKRGFHVLILEVNQLAHYQRADDLKDAGPDQHSNPNRIRE